MEFGIALFTSDRGIEPKRAAKAAESAGFSTFYVPEHTHIPVNYSNHPEAGEGELPDDRYKRTLDPWVALASASAVTSTIRLGTSVALPLEHDPITLAKTIASLDFLSEGRVDVGIGFGWNMEELADHGVPVKRLRAVLAEYLALMQALWTEEEASFEGEFVQMSRSWAWPKPIQKPFPPVLVGAFGNERLFRWIAKSANGWITTPIEQGLGDSVGLLRRIWEEEGREGQPRIVVLHGRGADSAFDEYQELGIDEVQLGIPDTSANEAEDAIAKYAGLIERYRA